MKKKSLIISLLLLCIAGLAKAQTTGEPAKRSEFSIGLGYSTDFLSNLSLKNLFKHIGERGEPVSDAARRSGYHLTYAYHLDRRWALGATTFYKVMKSEQSITFNDYHYENRYKQQYFGGALEGQYAYYVRKRVRIYSLVGAGAYALKKTWKKTEGEEVKDLSGTAARLAYQVSPFCIEAGTFIGVKMEFGYGYKGIGTIDLFYRF